MLGVEVSAGTAESACYTAQHTGPAELVFSLRPPARSLPSFTRQQVLLCPTLRRWGLQSSFRQRFSRFFVSPTHPLPWGGVVSCCSGPVRGMDVLTGSCTSLEASLG